MSNNINNNTNIDGGTTECKLVSIHSDELKPTDEKDMRCAPTKEFKNGSCIPLHILVEMAKAYNLDNPKNEIPLSTTHETVNPDKYKRYLVKQFKHKLSGTCNNQQCWTKQPFTKRLNERIKEELKNDTLRPKGPATRSTWLNTNDINKVMDQYKNKYSDFNFLGAVPIDFDELPEYDIKDFDFAKSMKEGKPKLGVIFNTDPHYKSGQHWIAMYADLNKGECYFFDSYGMAPEEEVRTLMKRIANFIKKDLGKKPIMDHNRMQHQKLDHDCGVYSIAFILRLLRGESFEIFNQTRIPDKEINECRQFYFT